MVDTVVCCKTNLMQHIQGRALGTEKHGRQVFIWNTACRIPHNLYVMSNRHLREGNATRKLEPQRHCVVK